MVTDIKALINLALKQNDEKIFRKILKQIIKVIEIEGLDKEFGFTKDFKALKGETDINAVIVLLNKINSLLPADDADIEVQSYFPSNITANKITLEKIFVEIKNKRVKEKLRYLFDNMNDTNFLRVHSKGFPSIDKSIIDLFCFNYIITGGLTIRILYFVDRNNFRFCDFFLEHDEYDRAWKSGRYLKNNFKNETWLLIPRF